MLPCPPYIRHEATHDMDCQPGDCRWPVGFSQVFVWIFMPVWINTLSLSPPRVKQKQTMPKNHEKIQNGLSHWNAIVNHHNENDTLPNIHYKHARFVVTYKASKAKDQ